MSNRDLLFLDSLSRTMWRYWFRGVVVFSLIAGAAGTATVLWPRTYQSEARLYVRLGRETVHLDPTATTGQTVSLADTREREILSVLELLRTRALFENVVDELGVQAILNEEPVVGYGGVTDWSHLLRTAWHKKTERSSELPTGLASPDDNSLDTSIAGLRRRENAIRKLMQSISSSSPKNSNVIIISCKAGSPGAAQERLVCVLKNYQEQHLRLHRISGSFEFFETQAQEKKELLDAKFKELRDAKNRISVASVDSQRELLSREATAITGSLLEAQAGKAAAAARLESLLASLPDAEDSLTLPEASGMSSDAIDLMRARLFELEIEQKRLIAQLQPGHTKLKAIEEQVGEALRLLRRQEVLVERSIILNQQQIISAAEEQQTQVYIKLRTLNEDEVLIKDLEREVASLEIDHRKASENREQARTDEELARNQISNINVAQAPSFAAKPVSPNLGLNLIFGLAAALGGAFTFVFQSTVRHGMTTFHDDVARAVTAPPPPFTPTPETVLRPANRPTVSNGV